MKTINKIIFGIILAFAVISCENPIGLGNKLDLNGPVLEFTAPIPRKAVTSGFVLEGTASDISGIGRLLVKVEKNREAMPKQWRYYKGNWEVSEDFGNNWKHLDGASWEGDTTVIWSIPISMLFNGIIAEDGEYQFVAQAWDKNDTTDDNSFKTLILIVDNDPPKVSVFNPVLYDRFIGYNASTDTFNNTELEDLRKLGDWRDPEYIGKFQTNSFQLQYNIDDNFNVWSFDMRFYEMGVEIDNIPETPLPDDYIYRFNQNVPPVPENPTPENYVKPNGSVVVPPLEGGGTGNYGGELRKNISTKTTIRVVAVCYDAAGNITQEKTLGFFIYWPQADIPWITYSGDLYHPEYYNNEPFDTPDFYINVQEAFMVYPGRDIKAMAFHAQGVKEVNFSLYLLEEPTAGTTIYDPSKKTLIQEFDNRKIENPPRSDNNYSTSFTWSFSPPPRSAFYIVEAVTTSVSGKESDVASVLFRVKDISFPDFPYPLTPPALDPLFQYIEDNSITIRGIVSDATKINSLCLVWINPESKGFAAQSQLAYFREPGYLGWKKAIDECIAGGPSKSEDLFDTSKPNKVWKLDPVLMDAEYPPYGINPETQRVEYRFSIKIPLDDLNIGIGKQPLKSQVFLLRAENPSPKTTIITYTPQGDEAPPTIEIKEVYVNSNKLTPGQFGMIDKLKDGDVITINGDWREGSVKYLPFETYLQDTFEISINQIKLPAPLPLKNFTGTNNSDSGTWTAEAIVGTTKDITIGSLKDTLVVAAKLKDIGGNIADDGASWLIQSDTLRLVRISSEMADQTYNEGKTIEIFLDFNKPVNLKNGGNPLLALNVTGGGTTTAKYKDGQAAQNTRQYFVYNVQAGQSTTGTWLDVTGLSGYGTGDYWVSGTYPFTWESGSGDNREEIRLTMNNLHTEGTVGGSGPGSYLLRRLPVATEATDAIYTLARGKNIGIDTTAPTVTSIRSSNTAGHYAKDAVIFIDLVFSEAVTIGAAVPQLQLTLGSNTVTTDGNVTVNNNVVTFSYKVNTGDTTGASKVIVNSTMINGSSITDIAGTSMAAITLDQTNRTLNGGGTGTGIFVNTVAPAAPLFRALSANNNGNVITTTVDSVVNTGQSDADNKTLKNVYYDNLWFSITPTTTQDYQIGSLEYSLDSGTNWKKIDSVTGTPFQQTTYGTYNVITRQIDKAGNISASSAAVSLTWDPGTLVTRVDSTTPNGTYTNTGTRTDKVNVTVYFRKPITTTGTPTITLNARRGTATPITYATVTGDNISEKNSISFTYAIANNDNTPTASDRTQYLNVTSFTITATDAEGVTVDTFIKPPTDDANKLGERKDIKVRTVALALDTTITPNPAYAFTPANDEASGTITFTFNGDITKNSGDFTMKQQAANYRLPAVLTDAQASRYKSAKNFNDFYSKGTNGFTGGAPDTSTKYILNYGETTLVTPASTGTAQVIMANDFLTAESVTLPVSSQDITIVGNKLTINITGSNALQVLGAVYDIVIPQNFVQDDLSYSWPTAVAGQSYTYTTPGINRPFVRVDKKINEDRITATGSGSLFNPHLMANFDRVIQTRARLDCRTPGSIVRYNTGDNGGQEYAATGPTTRNGYTTFNNNWRNDDTANGGYADSISYLTERALLETGNTGTNYTNFNSNTVAAAGTHITVGTTNAEGFVWRISVRSRNGANGTTNSALYEDIALRTVLTYEANSFTATAYDGRQIMGSGDQMWIRGGDAIGSSSIPGFPINWQDDYSKLKSEEKRAGIRLLQMVSSNGTNFNTLSVWRWVTWEINVRTWYDVVLGRDVNTGTAQDAKDAWQYGPRQWAYHTGGWSTQKDSYTLYPGKHRWVRITNEGAGNAVMFSSQFSIRGAQTLSLDQPNP